MKHILLGSIEFKVIKNIEPTKNFFYDITLGAWLSNEDSSLLILDKSFNAIGSKKKDIETGEDQK